MPLRTLLTFARISALICCLAASAAAQITFTAVGVNDNADLSHLGIAQGTPYTFVFTLGPSFANNASSAFNSGMNYWAETSAAHDRMWTDVSTTTFAGSYVAPAVVPSNAIYLTSGSGLQFSAYDDSASHSIGMTTLAGDIDIRNITITARTLTSGWNFAGYHQEPATYFTNYAGTYVIDASYNPMTTNGISVGFADGGVIPFRLQSLTIGATAIPEPSTYAVIVGLSALGVVTLRRWGARRPSC